MGPDAIRAWLLGRLGALIGVPAGRVDAEAPFARHGLDSAALVSLAGELEGLLGRRLPPTALYEHPTVEALVAHLAGAPGGAPAAGPAARAEVAGGVGGEPIAVVGIGCHFPAGRGPEAFWRSLLAGVDAVTEVPPARFHADALFDPDRASPGKTLSRWGGFCEGVDEFDAPFFGVAPGEAKLIDPQQRMLLQVAWEALEDAGVVPRRLAGRPVGVFVGISHSDYGELGLRDLARVGAASGAGGALSVAANRVSYALDLRGPSLAVDTACSSSLVALHLACRSLRAGEVELALAGGANLLLSPALWVGFSKAGLLSPAGRCKAFDAAADGYVRGEGAGLVVLKRLADARRDGDDVYAVVRGSAVNQDGRSNGLMAPNPRAQEAVLRAAYADAGVDPARVDYVEAHGTGTPLGDLIEAGALGAVVGAGRGGAGPCAIGSVKTNVGHLEAAAGVAGLIKTALALKHGRLPASLHLREPNPAIAFGALGLRVQAGEGPWPRREGPAIAGVSSFGFGGTNAHVVLEAVTPPGPAAEHESPGPAGGGEGGGAHVLCLSARDEGALRRLARAYAEQLGGPGSPALADVAYGALARRSRHPRRLALVAASAAEAAERLRAFAGGAGAGAEAGGLPGPFAGEASGRPRVVFVYSGQGSQWPRMGAGLRERYPIFAGALERCDAAFKRQGLGSPIERLEDGADASRFGETDVAQPALFAVQIALTELFRSWGVVPDAVVGHSVGEAAAAYAAGALGLEDAARVVAARAALMRRAAGRGRVALVAAAPGELEAALAGFEGRASIAAVNGPGASVVSGDADAVEALARGLEARGVAVRWLPTDVAFHSHHMQPLVDELVDELRGLEPRPLVRPMISTVTGGPIEGRHLHADYWGRNLREPVAFYRAIGSLDRAGEVVFVELGGTPVLGRDVEAALRERGASGAVLASLRRDAPAEHALLATLGALYARGVEPEARGLYPAGARPLRLPTYRWARERHWFDAPRPARGGEAAGAKAKGGAEASGAPGAHPLLGPHLELADRAGEHVWQGTLEGAGLAYLDDHRVRGAVIFPAAGFVELALAAAAEALPGRRAVVEGLALREFLPLDPARPIALQARALPDAAVAGALAFRVHAREARRAEAGWGEYATARLRPEAPGGPEGGLDLAALRERCDEAADVGALYEALARAGFEYGPAFRGLREARRREGEAFGRVALSGPLAEGAGRYVAHPALLDACFHLLAAALPREANAGATFVPERVERVVVGGPLGGEVWAHVALRGGAAADGFEADLRLAGDDGALRAELFGVRLRRVRAKPERAPDAGHGLRFYEVAWRPEAAPPAAPPAGAGAGEGWLIFADRGGVGRRLAELLRARGAPCALVEAGDDVAPGGAAVSRAQLRAIVHEHLGPGRPPCRGVVYLWALDAPDNDALGGEAAGGPGAPKGDALARAEALAGVAPLHLVQSLAFAAARAPRLWAATRGARPIGGDAPALAQAPLWGLVRGAAFEAPELRATLVDLDPRAGADEAARGLLDELGRDDGEGQVARRGGERYVARLRRAGAGDGGAGAAVSPAGSYLVTGGAGALGLRIAEWLVAQGARRLVLVGRRAPSAAAEASIGRLRAAGAEVLVRRADVARAGELAEALGSADDPARPLRGVVHAAGVLEDGALLQMDAAQLARVLAPKLRGAFNLHRLTLGAPLDFFALFSSAASVLGSPGQANYMAANAFLDALAHARRAEGRCGLSVNWGPWAEAGMAAGDEAVRAQLVRAIEPGRGAAAFGALLAGGAAQRTALAFEVETILQFYPEGAGVEFFSELLRGDLQALGGAAPRTRARPSHLGRDYVAPRTELERTIAALWQRALNVEAVGVDDNFFELGGDSVLASQIVAQANKTFGVRVGAREAFEAITVARLAALVERELHAALDALSDEEAERLLGER